MDMNRDAATRAEETVRAELLGRHDDWTVELDGVRWWVIRDRAGILLARNRDIFMAGKVAEGTRA